MNVWIVRLDQGCLMSCVNWIWKMAMIMLIGSLLYLLKNSALGEMESLDSVLYFYVVFLHSY